MLSRRFFTIRGSAALLSLLAMMLFIVVSNVHTDNVACRDDQTRVASAEADASTQILARADHPHSPCAACELVTLGAAMPPSRLRFMPRQRARDNPLLWNCLVSPAGSRAIRCTPEPLPYKTLLTSSRNSHPCTASSRVDAAAWEIAPNEALPACAGVDFRLLGYFSEFQVLILKG